MKTTAVRVQTILLFYLTQMIIFNAFYNNYY